MWLPTGTVHPPVCPALPSFACRDLRAFVPSPGLPRAEIRLGGQDTDMDVQGDWEGLTAETRLQAPQKGNS